MLAALVAATWIVIGSAWARVIDGDTLELCTLGYEICETVRRNCV